MNRLISDILYMAKNNGINFRTKQLVPLLHEYNMNDWKQYKRNNENYGKNIIFENNIIEITLMSWNKYSLSPLNMFVKNDNVIKILDGCLYERYITKLYRNSLYCNKNILYKNDVLENKYVFFNKMGLMYLDTNLQISNGLVSRISNNGSIIRYLEYTDMNQFYTLDNKSYSLHIFIK
jgi:hypothetical protein